MKRRVSLQEALHLEKFHHYCARPVATQFCSFVRKANQDWMAYGTHLCNFLSQAKKLMETYALSTVPAVPLTCSPETGPADSKKLVYSPSNAEEGLCHARSSVKPRSLSWSEN